MVEPHLPSSAHIRALSMSVKGTIERPCSRKCLQIEARSLLRVGESSKRVARIWPGAVLETSSLRGKHDVQLATTPV
jgi:hypothetical protein